MNGIRLSFFNAIIFLLLCSTTTDIFSGEYSIANYKMPAHIKKQIEKKTNETHLRSAARDNDIDKLNHLISIDVNINAQSDYGAESALHLAAENGNLNTVRILLNKENINVNVQNSKKKTPLNSALHSFSSIKENNEYYENFVTMIKLLLEKKAHVIIGENHFDKNFALSGASTPPNGRDIYIHQEISKICSEQSENYFLDITYQELPTKFNTQEHKEKRKYFNRIHCLLLCARLENPDLCGVKDLEKKYLQQPSYRTTTITDLNQFYH